MSVDRQDHMARRPSGVYSDPSHADAPPGSLRVADNVVIRRSGHAGPRPGFAPHNQSGSGNTLLNIHPWDSDALLMGDPETEWLAAVGIIKDEAGADLKWENGTRAFAAAARKNLYLNTSPNVKKLTAAGDLVASATGYEGVPVITNITHSGTNGTWFDKQNQVAYKALLYRRDENGIIVRGIPSAATVVRNSSNNTEVIVTVDVSLPGTTVEGDWLEIYRTQLQGDVIPGQEFQLTHTVELEASHIAAQLYSLAPDLNGDDQLGAFLYTSPSQGGAEALNFPPPACGDLALYRGSLFCADIKSRRQVILNYNYTSTNLVGVADGIGDRIVQGIRTNGSDTITGVLDTTGVEAGMVLLGGGWTAGAYPAIIVLAVTVSTIQVAGTWNAATDPGVTAIDVYDALHIGALIYSTGISPEQTMLEMLVQNPPPGITPILVGNGIRRSDEFTTWPVTLLLIRNDGTGAPFRIQATHGGEYAPRIPLFMSGEFADGSSDATPNGLAWSKTDQPEAFPLPNLARVGPSAGGGAGSVQAQQQAQALNVGTERIMRIVPTRDALWIFRSDGIWRLTGSGAFAGWRIDPFDKSAHLLCPKSIAVLNDTVYAWTNQGIVAVSDAGVQKISELAIGDLLRDAQIRVGPNNISTPGAFACANHKDNEIVFGVVDASTNTAARELWVHNTKTGAWVRWDFDDFRCGVHDVVDNQLLFGRHSDGVVWEERQIAELQQQIGDREQVMGLDAIDFATNTITVSGSPAWTLKVGDMVYVAATGAGSVVTKVNSPTEYVLANAQGFSIEIPPIVTFVEAIRSRIVPIAHDLKNPHITKHFKEASFSFSVLTGVESMDMLATSSLSQTLEQQRRTLGFFGTGAIDTGVESVERSVRFFVPRNHSRCSRLFIGFEIQQAGALWTYDSMAVSYGPQSTRVRT